MQPIRKLTNGNVGQLGELLEVHVLDEPGVGGASHCYAIINKNDPNKVYACFNFQTGGVLEAGVNGISNEALLAIVIDRLEGFSKGAYPSPETSIALTKCQEALHWMEHRTRERAARCVEGKHEV